MHQRFNDVVVLIDFLLPSSIPILRCIAMCSCIHQLKEIWVVSGAKIHKAAIAICI